MSKKQILIAEDEAVTAMDLQTSLIQLGYGVSVTYTVSHNLKSPLIHEF